MRGAFHDCVQQFMSYHRPVTAMLLQDRQRLGFYFRSQRVRCYPSGFTRSVAIAFHIGINVNFEIRGSRQTVQRLQGRHLFIRELGGLSRDCSSFGKNHSMRAAHTGPLHVICENRHAGARIIKIQNLAVRLAFRCHLVGSVLT